jgi:hypothetical protein
MSGRTAFGRHRFCETAKIDRRAPKSRWRYESSKPLPPREEAVADQNLDRSGDRKPADAEPPSQLRFTVDARPRLTPRKILSKPIEELEVERPRGQIEALLLSRSPSHAVDWTIRLGEVECQEARSLPLNLHGLKGPELFRAVYVSRDRLAAWRAGAPDRIRWIVISSHGIPYWARGWRHRDSVPDHGRRGTSRCCMAMTTLPCFVADADPSGEGSGPRPAHVRHVWLLTQGETRKTKRVWLFTEFISRGLAAYAPLLAGLSSGD